MNAARLALTELRRLTTSRLGKLAVVAMMLVPSLYGGFYLYANKDPYAALDRVPAAVVDEDAGTTLATGEKLAAGDEVARSLLDSGSFDWTRTDRAGAEQGIETGRYDFALIIPASFSADLASSADLEPRQATIELATNDANGYLSTTVANQLVKEVTTSVAEKVSTTAASQILAGFSTIHDRTTKAADGAAKLASGLDDATEGAGDLATGGHSLAAGEQKLVDGTAALARGASDLDTGLQTLRNGTSDLPTRTKQLATGARQVADGNKEVASAGKEVAAASDRAVGDLTETRGRLATRLEAAGFSQDEIDRILAVADDVAEPLREANTRIQSTSTQLTQLSDGATKVADGASQLATAASQLKTGIAEAASGSGSLASGARTLQSGQQDALAGAKRLDTGAASLHTGLGTLADGAHELEKGLRDGLRSIPDPSPEQRKAVAQTLGNPIAVDTSSAASAADYGAGLAPFFMSLAIWIGAFVLTTRVRSHSTRAVAAGQPRLRIALGGWLAPAVLGVAQAVLAYLVIIAGVGISTAHPVLLLLFMGLISVTFTAIVNAVVMRFGLVGQFVALVLLVVQLISAGGTFPWQTLPEPLHPLHHVLPMSYAVDGIRRLMYGGSFVHLSLDIGVLLAYWAGAILLGTVAAARLGTWSASRVKPQVTAP